MRKLGIDIGGSSIKYAVFDKYSHCLESWSKETKPFATLDEFYNYLFDGLELSTIKTLGICAPGLISKDGVVEFIQTPNCMVLANSNMNQDVYSRTGFKVQVINDAKAAGMCEIKHGKAKDADSVVLYLIGTGIGGCIIVDQEIVNGHNGFAGEFSYQAIDEGSKYLQVGNQTSMSGLVRTYNNLGGQAKQGKDVFDAYLNHEDLARQAVDAWLRSLCSQLLTISSFINPEYICLGGSISKESWLIDLIDKEYKKGIREFLCTDKIMTQLSTCSFNQYTNCLGAVYKSEEY